MFLLPCEGLVSHTSRFLGLNMRAVCSCATVKFTIKEECLGTSCEVGRLSRSSAGND